MGITDQLEMAAKKQQLAKEVESLIPEYNPVRNTYFIRENDHVVEHEMVTDFFPPIFRPVDDDDSSVREIRPSVDRDGVESESNSVIERRTSGEGNEVSNGNEASNATEVSNATEANTATEVSNTTEVSIGNEVSIGKEVINATEANTENEANTATEETPIHEEPPRVQLLLTSYICRMNHHFFTLRHCSSCNIFIPPRAYHCRFCDMYVERGALSP